MSRKLSRDSREVLRRMLARPEPIALDDNEPSVCDLRRRGLLRLVSSEVAVSAHCAARIEHFQLTPRGVQVAEQITRNKIGRDLCWDS